MAQRIDRAFFDEDHVVLAGWTPRHGAWFDSVIKAFETQGTTVHLVSPRGGTHNGKTVHPTLDTLPVTPGLVCVFTRKETSATLVPALQARGIRKVAFASSLSGDTTLVQACRDRGMEAVTACPLMALGTGFHRLHGWLAGVRG